MKKHILAFALLSALLTMPSLLRAQQWMWGVRGGSSSDMAGTYSDERVYDMAADPHGNVYTASLIASAPSARLGNATVSTYSSNPGAYHPNNAMLTSYSCNGALRWKKLIGGDESCLIQSVRTDSTGHVYILGTVNEVSSSPTNPMAIHMDSDTTLPYNLYKRIFIAQYDTSGHFKWIRMPEADTTTLATYSRAAAYDMAIDDAGNLNVVIFLNAGSLTGSGFNVPANGLYILRYNQQGTLLSAIQPPGFNITVVTTPPLVGYPNAAFESFRLGRTKDGNWIIAGSQSPYVGPTGFTLNGQQVTHPAFAAGFNSQWQHIWHYVADTDTPRFMGHPVADASGNIFLTGLTGNGIQFLGETISTAGIGAIPFLAKLSSGGTKQWLTYASGNDVADGNCHALCSGRDIALSGSGEIVLTGGAVGLKWGNVQLPGKCNTQYKTFVARINSVTGTVADMDTIPVGGSGNFVPGGNFGLAVAAGKDNQVFVGGQMTYGQITGNDTLNFIGGDMDFFIAKYGYPCNCSTPAAAFTQSGNGTTVSFTYTGSTTNTDSLVWTFGDGQSLTRTGAAMTAAFSHTYATNGSYTACVMAYGACGSNQACHDIQAGGTGIGAIGLAQGMKAYPNPATEVLILEGATGNTARIINMTGQLVRTTVIKAPHQGISLQGLPAGNYLLTLTGAGGYKGSMLFVKQ